MSNEDLSKLKRAAGVIGAPDMVLEKNGSGSSLTVKDKKNDTANNYSFDVNTNGEGEFNFFATKEIEGLNIPKTDQEQIWPLFQKHRGGFFSGHFPMWFMLFCCQNCVQESLRCLSLSPLWQAPAFCFCSFFPAGFCKQTGPG